MNRRVFVSMLTLCMVFLTSMYFLKLFFPEEFMFNVQNERVISIGMYIDEHIWLCRALSAFTAFITYGLFCCAACGRFRLGWKLPLIIAGSVITVQFLSIVDNNVATALDYALFFLLPWISNGKLKNCAITFSIHIFSQALSLSIRGLATYLVSANFLVIFLLTFECYLWLALLAIIFNYKSKKEV